MTQSYLQLLLFSTIIILATRWGPFFFASLLQRVKMIESIGKQLPAYIMMLLLIYEIKLNSFLSWPYALPEMLALTVIICVHLWLRQVLFSMFVGTLTYLLLTHIMH